MIDEYSLWLIPPGKTYKKLDELIKTLSKNLDSPYFPPHVTLLGKISLPKKELILRTQELSNALFPFYISLENINHSEDYVKNSFKSSS